MAGETACPSCGASGGGLVCAFCGAGIPSLWDEKSEMQALGIFHQLVAKKAMEERPSLLATGFIPRTREALIEAGALLIPSMSLVNQDMSTAEAAAARLEGILSRLRMLPQDDRTRAALREFEGKLKEHRSSHGRELMFGGVICLLLLGAIAWAASRFFG